MFVLSHTLILFTIMTLNKIFFLFLKEDFITKSTKTTLFTKYIHICTSHHQLHIKTQHIIQNEVLTMDIEHLSNGQLSRKVVQLIYVGCPRLMQIYLVYRIAMGFILLSFGVPVKLSIDILRL